MLPEPKNEVRLYAADRSYLTRWDNEDRAAFARLLGWEGERILYALRPGILQHLLDLRAAASGAMKGRLTESIEPPGTYRDSLLDPLDTLVAVARKWLNRQAVGRDRVSEAMLAQEREDTRARQMELTVSLDTIRHSKEKAWDSDEAIWDAIPAAGRDTFAKCLEEGESTLGAEPDFSWATNLDAMQDGNTEYEDMVRRREGGKAR